MTTPTVPKPPAPISMQAHAKRRRALMELAGDDAIVVIPAAPMHIRSRDTHHRYRQDSDFWYLSGFPEPESVLVLIPGREAGESLLFCRDRDPEREAWDGVRQGPEGAVTKFVMDDAYPIDDMDDILPSLLEGRSRVYYHFGRDVAFDVKLIGWVNSVRAKVRSGATPPHEFLELGHIIDELRLFKSADEIKLMRHSAAIAVAGHQALRNALRPGVHEYELQAELEYVFAKHHACPAYESIVGGGERACILHYINNDQPIADGQMVLVDAGAEYQGYASDITRTWAVNGEPSAAQTRIRDIVISAQHAAIAAANVGAQWLDPHRAAVRVLTEGLCSLGILRGNLDELIDTEAYLPYYPHKSGHWLGLDVHDVGDYRVDGQERMLEAGMVFTIEPGLYFPHHLTEVPEAYRGLGVRIEDDILLTKNGTDVLTSALPQT